MKKLLSFLLATVMLFTLMVPVIGTLAADTETYEAYPMIHIRGTGEELFDGEGKLVNTSFEAFDDESEDGVGTDAIIESCVNILLPFLLEGLPEDKWDNYGKAIYEELAPLWDKASLDGDGNPKYGTNVSLDVLAAEEQRATIDQIKNGQYELNGPNTYRFPYDWRLSPYDHVDRFHEYIKTIIKATGKDQVCIGARCVGGSLLMAYLEKYGDEGLVKKVFFSEVLSNGSAYISDCFSGKIDFDSQHLQNYLMQMEYCGENDLADGIVMTEFLTEILNRTFDILTQTGVTDTLLEPVESLYARVYKELLPSVLLAAGMATWPNYWANVYDRDFDNALNFVFGEEGSERRVEYAGLIEKIRYYREHVTAQLPNLYTKFNEEYGIEIGVLAKYGFFDFPFMEHHDELGDSLIGLYDSSLGATVVDAYTPLSQSYIDSRIALGYGDYISPDGMVDASTCLFPETTWFVKNSHHSYTANYDYIAQQFFRDETFTVSSNSMGLSRFLVYDESVPCEAVNMTEENMAGFDWISTAVEEPTLESRIRSLIKWLEIFIEFIIKLFSGEISLNIF